MHLFCMMTTTIFCPFTNKSNTLLWRIRTRLYCTLMSKPGTWYYTTYGFIFVHVYWNDTFSIHSLSRPTSYQWQQCFHYSCVFLLWNLVHIWITLFRNSITLMYNEFVNWVILVYFYVFFMLILILDQNLLWALIFSNSHVFYKTYTFY